MSLRNNIQRKRRAARRMKQYRERRGYVAWGTFGKLSKASRRAIRDVLWLPKESPYAEAYNRAYMANEGYRYSTSIYGECAKHPGQNMVNCPLCAQNADLSKYPGLVAAAIQEARDRKNDL